MDLISKFKAARRVGTPLIGITTPEPASLMASLTTDTPENFPILIWDSMRGMTPGNEKGRGCLKKLIPEDELGITVDPTVAFSVFAKLPEDSLCYFMNAHRYLSCPDKPEIAQGVWNLRDPFKGTGKTLVLLGPSLQLPPELVYDVILMDDPLPDDKQLEAIFLKEYELIRQQYAKIPEPDEALCRRVVDSLRGLSSFSAEQVVAMSLTKNGILVENLWEYRRSIIQQTNGIQIVDSGETYSHVGGLQSIKDFMHLLFRGKKPPSSIIFIDEIEKMFAGATHALGDNTGVSQDSLGVMLKAMQNYRWTGIIAVGCAGSGKSMIAKATGNTFKVPTMEVDLGGTKHGIVGESEARIRSLVKVIHAVSGSGAFFIATCNRLESLPPELQRRFKAGIWYFDLPTAEERKSIWDLTIRAYGLDSSQELPDDQNWTGADIDKVCDIADKGNCSLREAAQFIVPVSVSSADTIEMLRRTASGRFRSASYPGVYKFDHGMPNLLTETPGRRFSLDSLD
jgi:hypothetical protein